MLSVSSSSSLTVEEAKENLLLSVDGYEHDVATSMKSYLSSATTTIKDAYELFAALFNKYLSVASQFDSQDESAVIGTLSKTNKDKLDTIIPTLIAQKQIKARTNAVLALIRQLELFKDIYADSFKSTEVPATLKSGFCFILYLIA